MLDVETKEQVIQDVEFNFIELPKFNKTVDQLTTPIDQWTYFIKNAENLTIIPKSVQDEGLKEAYTAANQQNWTKLELDDYLRAAISEQDEMGRIEFAEKEAKLEEKIGLAKIMKENDEPIDKIIKYTVLTKEEIEKL